MNEMNEVNVLNEMELTSQTEVILENRETEVERNIREYEELLGY